MIQFYDICKAENFFRYYGEELEDWKIRVIEEYIPKFKELCLFNDSMGDTKMPLNEALANSGWTLDEYCLGYVTACFEDFTEENFMLLPEK